MSAPAGTVVDFAMPSLGADMDDGRITEWLVKPGDTVERGQIVVVVETDKSDIEVEVFEPGVVTELLVEEGDRVAVGTPIARIERTAPDARPTTPAPAPTPTPVPEVVEVAPGPAPSVTRQITPHMAPHVTSPVIRHLAEHLHVDADAVRGSGPGGRVSRDDVVHAAEVRRLTPRARRLIAEHGVDPRELPDERVVTGDDILRAVAEQVPDTVRDEAAAAPAPSRADTMRRHIAQLMTRSWQEIPHYHVTARLDLGTATAALARHNAERPLAERLVTGAVLLCATARAAAAVPGCNGWWRDGRFEQAGAVDLGVVLSLRTGGIVVPTIERADELTATQMMSRLSEIVQRARQGRLRASDMSAASITVTNLGDLGAESVAGVIHPPQVVLVGFGAVRDDVWADAGSVAIRPTVVATLAGDHRAIDGVTGSRFLAQLQRALDQLDPDEERG